MYFLELFSLLILFDTLSRVSNRKEKRKEEEEEEEERKKETEMKKPKIPFYKSPCALKTTKTVLKT